MDMSLAQWKGKRALGACWTSTDDDEIVLLQSLTPNKCQEQLVPTLDGYNVRCEAHGAEPPDVVYTDNTADRSLLEKCMPKLAHGVVEAQPHNPQRLPEATLEKVEVVYITSTTDCDQFVSIQLMQGADDAAEEGAHYEAALDTEWPTDSSHKKIDKLSLLQIAPKGAHLTVMFNLYALTHGFSAPFPPSLRAFLEHPSVKFIGSRVDIDVRYLREDWGVTIRNHDNATCNLAMVCKSHGWPIAGNAGLQKIAAIVLGVCFVCAYFVRVCARTVMCLHGRVG